MKVLFLDFDGVTNVERYINAVYEICKRLGLDYNEALRDSYGNYFCPTTMNLLNWIIETTGCKLVITSTWRHSGEVIMKEMWEARQYPGEIIGITETFMKDTTKTFFERQQRGHEIKAYLDEHPEIEAYCIVDDNNDMLDEQQPFTVITDEQIGLTTNDTLKIINILTL